jgi:hypothetical protein
MLTGIPAPDLELREPGMSSAQITGPPAKIPDLKEVARIATDWCASLEHASSTLDISADELRQIVAPTLWQNLDAPLRAESSALARMIASRPDALGPLCAAFLGSVVVAAEEPTVPVSSDTAALTRRALWAVSMGWLDEAVSDVRAVLSVTAFDPRMWYCLGILRCVQSAATEAAEAFMKSARYLGEDRSSTAAFAWLAAASTLELGGLESQAVALLKEATSKTACPELLMTLARVSGQTDGLETAFRFNPTLILDASALGLTGLEEPARAALASFGAESRQDLTSEDRPARLALTKLALRWSAANREYRLLGGSGPAEEPVIPPEPVAPIRFAVTDPATDSNQNISPSSVQYTYSVESRLRDEEERYGQALETFRRRTASRQAAIEELAKWERRKKLLQVAPMSFETSMTADRLTATATNLIASIGKWEPKPFTQPVGPHTQPVERPRIMRRGPATVIDDHLLVATRSRSLIVEQLEMKCDAREIPSPLGVSQGPADIWIIGHAIFGGASNIENDPTPDEQKYAKVQGLAALSICGVRLLGIVAPNAPTQHSAWLSWSIPSLAIAAMGSQGTFKQRPKVIKIDRNGGVDGEGQTLLLQHVMKTLPSSRRAQEGQEAALFARLMLLKRG